MRLSFVALLGFVSASAVVACGRTGVDDFDISANPPDLGGPGGAGGTGGTGGTGGGVGGAGATGGMSVSSSSGTGGGPSLFCGDGKLGPDEKCDDGNTNVNDACVKCGFASCGDGFLWFGVEQCDDANGNLNDECPSCQKAFCGDGFVWAGFEQCDDGNLNDGDGCTSKCTLPTMSSCGNGIIEPGEQCDDGNTNVNDACILCQKGFCGDKFVWAGVEQCDDGNTIDNDACSNKCTLPSMPVCGNGIIETGEQCDDANPSSNDACIFCKKALCGDGFVWAGIEQCDDGNTIDNDACSNTCKLPAMQACGNGMVEPGEQCDDGNTTNGDGCSSTCKLPFCGDGFVDPAETCDLGSQNADRPALLVQQGATRIAVRPIDRTANVTTFYAYGSASSHTGYEVLSGSRIYFYRDSTTGNVSLVFHHGIDFNSSGQNQPQGTVNFAFTGLPSNVIVLVADDSPSELSKASTTTATGKWSLQNNSDGGALGTFPFPGNFTVAIAPTFSPAINDWAWIDGSETLTTLGLTQSIQITAYSTPSACRIDCSVPACGDGILDGGEVCDDGNTTGGDGCGANCTSLN